MAPRRVRTVFVALRARRAAWLDRNHAAIDRQEPWWALLPLVITLYGLMTVPPAVLFVSAGRLGGVWMPSCFFHRC